MKESYGNLWELEADAICITTNGAVKRNGCAVMGRGCALEAKNKFPGLDYHLGNLLKSYGNVLFNMGLIEKNGPLLLTFPVKHHWREKADINLIKKSAQQLMEAIDNLGLTNVLLPRPGCGNGQLSWEKVKPIIESILDDRVTVITH